MRAAIVVGVALLVATLPTAAAEEEVIFTYYSVGWDQVDDFSRCGWDIIRTPFVASGQDTWFFDYGESRSGEAARAATTLARSYADGPVRDLSLMEDDTWGNVAEDAVLFAEYAKCLVTRYELWAANTFVWYNPPVACYLKDTAGCGVDTTVCQVVWPADVIIWGLEWPPGGTPAPVPCLPPTNPSCVPPADPLRCLPPSLPPPPEVLS